MAGGSELNKSYFYAVDDKCGYGNISYFTYFSEFNRSWKNAGHLEAGMMTSLFAISVLGNVFIIGFLLKHKSSRTITNYFVCNLAIADVSFALSAPFVAHVRITNDWRFGEGMCRFLNYWMFVCAGVIIWTMTVISVDRYMCIYKGVSAKTRIKPTHVAVICVSLWIVFSCAFLPLALFFHVKDIQLSNETSIKFCTLLWPNSSVRYSTIFTIVVLMIGFAIPLSIIMLNYYKIFRKLWTSNTAIANTSKQTRGGRMTSVRRSRDLKIIKTLVILVVLFIIMWLPMFIVIGCIQRDVSVSANNISSSALTWTIIVAYVNPCVNPFLYGFMNREISRSLRLCCRNRTENEDSEKPNSQTAFRTTIDKTTKDLPESNGNETTHM